MIDSDRMRHLRLDWGLSQRKLAAAGGVDPLTIKRLEAGADPGDLPLRVLAQIAHALGVPPADLLAAPSRPTPTTNEDLVLAVGSVLFGRGCRVTVSALANATGATVADIEQAVVELRPRVHQAGIALAQHGDTLWLAPRSDQPAQTDADRPLDVNQARLLRRIHRGEDVRRKLTRAERELVLPALLRRGLVTPDGLGLRVADPVDESLSNLSQAHVEVRL